MSFPVETVDGEIVRIVERTDDGKLIAEDGSIYKSSLDALRVELVEAVGAVGDAVEEVGEAVDVASEVVGDLKDGLSDLIGGGGDDEGENAEAAPAPEEAEAQ